MSAIAEIPHFLRLSSAVLVRCISGELLSTTKTGPGIFSCPSEVRCAGWRSLPEVYLRRQPWCSHPGL